MGGDRDRAYGNPASRQLSDRAGLTVLPGGDLVAVGDFNGSGGLAANDFAVYSFGTPTSMAQPRSTGGCHAGTAMFSAAILTICIGDFNCDGGVDGADVESFFLMWATGEPAGDVNADGGVDGGDVEFFFERWQAGC